MLYSNPYTLPETTPIAMLWIVKDPSQLSPTQLPLPDNEDYPYKHRLFKWADQETQRKIKLYYFSKNLTENQKQQMNDLSDVKKGGRENIEVIDFNARFEKNHDLNFLDNSEILFVWKVDIMRLIILLEDAPAIYFDFDILPVNPEKDRALLAAKEIKKPKLKKKEIDTVSKHFNVSGNNQEELLNNIKDKNTETLNKLLVNFHFNNTIEANCYYFSKEKRENIDNFTNQKYIKDISKDVDKIISEVREIEKSTKPQDSFIIKKAWKAILLNELTNIKKGEIGPIEMNQLGYKMALDKNPYSPLLENSILIVNNKNNLLISAIYNVIKTEILTNSPTIDPELLPYPDTIYLLYILATDTVYSYIKKSRQNNLTDDLIPQEKLEKALQNKIIKISPETISDYKSNNTEKLSYFGWNSDNIIYITRDESWEESNQKDLYIPFKDLKGETKQLEDSHTIQNSKLDISNNLSEVNSQSLSDTINRLKV